MLFCAGVCVVVAFAAGARVVVIVDGGLAVAGLAWCCHQAVAMTVDFDAQPGLSNDMVDLQRKPPCG